MSVAMPAEPMPSNMPPCIPAKRTPLPGSPSWRTTAPDWSRGGFQPTLSSVRCSVVDRSFQRWTACQNGWWSLHTRPVTTAETGALTFVWPKPPPAPSCVPGRPAMAAISRPADPLGARRRFQIDPRRKARLDTRTGAPRPPVLSWSRSSPSLFFGMAAVETASALVQQEQQYLSLFAAGLPDRFRAGGDVAAPELYADDGSSRRKKKTKRRDGVGMVGMGWAPRGQPLAHLVPTACASRG